MQIATLISNGEPLALGTTFIGIDLLTQPRVLKRSPHYARITKRTEGVSAMVSMNKTCHTYERMVQRSLVAQGSAASDFKLSPRTWGRRIPNTPFIQHNGKQYLELLIQKGVTPTVTYYLDGQPINKKDIIDLRESDQAPAQGGLENKVIVRTVKLENIECIRANGRVYRPRNRQLT